MKAWLNEFFRKIVGEDIYNTTTSLIDYKLHLSKDYNYKGDGTVYSDYVVFMADGKLKHGGLADRLRAMVSLYYYCKLVNVSFKAYFVSPFNLTEYLVPNVYDWEIDYNQLSFDNVKAKAIIVKNNRNDNLKYLKKRISSDISKKQLHIYTNIAINGIDYKQEFYELFKPSAYLQEEILKNKQEIGGKYVSVTFRFQQALGDFKESFNKPLSTIEQNLLIEKCLAFICKVKNKHSDYEKVLVTSDSVKFLRIAKEKNDFVYTIPGVIHHIDYTKDAGQMHYVKSFVDLYMLSAADYLYSYSTGVMYSNSGFAVFAAAIGGKPHKRVVE